MSAAPAKRSKRTVPPSGSSRSVGTAAERTPGSGEVDDAGRDIQVERQLSVRSSVFAVAVGTLWGAFLGWVSDAGPFLGAVSGAVGGLLWLARHALTPKLGRWTALAAMMVVGAVVLGGLSFVPAQCPDYVGDGGRCTVPDAAVFGLSGAAAVMLLWAFTLPLFAVRNLWSRMRNMFTVRPEWQVWRRPAVWFGSAVVAAAAVVAVVAGDTVRDVVWLVLGVLVFAVAYRTRPRR